MATIIAFGDQPGQVEAGLGGTILKLTESTYQVTIVDLTNGEPEKNHQSGYRKREAVKASRILGIDERITLDYPYLELRNSTEIQEGISEIYKNISPGIVFIPYSIDTQPRSKITAEICDYSIELFHQKDLTPAKIKIFYYFASPLAYFQKPSIIVDISKEIEMKVEALKCYESQFGKNIQNNALFENTLQLNRYYGMLIDKKFGESFVSKEPIYIQNIELII
ncbi:MAG: PIG-L family deacetylase [Candidatus Atribacteria bacterium]|nr:PIG-L family deacetylase [Candidatus Atribacteria bacterium]